MRQVSPGNASWLARILHNRFYCNRRFAAATSLHTDFRCAGSGLAARLAWRLRVPHEAYLAIRARLVRRARKAERVGSVIFTGLAYRHVLPVSLRNQRESIRFCSRSFMKPTGQKKGVVDTLNIVPQNVSARQLDQPFRFLIPAFTDLHMANHTLRGLGHSPKREVSGIRQPLPGLMARLGQSIASSRTVRRVKNICQWVSGVKQLRAGGDQAGHPPAKGIQASLDGSFGGVMLARQLQVGA